jgi:hypothetical protein
MQATQIGFSFVFFQACLEPETWGMFGLLRQLAVENSLPTILAQVRLCVFVRKKTNTVTCRSVAILATTFVFAQKKVLPCSSRLGVL